MHEVVLMTKFCRSKGFLATYHFYPNEISIGFLYTGSYLTRRERIYRGLCSGCYHRLSSYLATEGGDWGQSRTSQLRLQSVLSNFRLINWQKTNE